MRRLLLILASVLWLSGCFVLDELDNGAEIMDSHSPKRNKAAKAAAAAKAGTQGEEDPGPPTGEAWWSSARSLNTGPGEARDEGDPNRPVSCKIRGKTRFMRRGDCLSQGGRSS